MATIISDNPAIKSVLEKLVTLVTDNGARLHPEIEIVSSNGELSINSKLDRQNTDEIIWIPEACLPTVTDFNIKIEGGKLIAEPDTNKVVSKLHISIFDLMIALYNLTDKISSHFKTSPSLALCNAPNIVNHLYKGSLQRLNCDDVNKTAVSTFFASRYLKYGKNNESRYVLMPFLDFLNHHCNSHSYIEGAPTDVDNGSISALNSKPISSSNETFASYCDGVDSLSTYMSYGFVDIFSPELRSIPHVIDIGNIGKISVNRAISNNASPNETANQIDVRHPKDLHYYFPRINQLANNTLMVNSLIIPCNSAPLSLRRILAILIKLLSPNTGDTDLMKYILHAEERILSINNAYYDELQVLINSEPDVNISSDTRETLLLLIQTQKKHLTDYQMRLKN